MEVAVLLIFGVFNCAFALEKYQPEAVHIAYGGIQYDFLFNNNI